MSDTAMALLCVALAVATAVAYYFHARTRPGRMLEMSPAWKAVTPRW